MKKRQFILTVGDMEEYFGEEKYEEFIVAINKKYKIKDDECFWLIGEIEKATIGEF